MRAGMHEATKQHKQKADGYWRGKISMEVSGVQGATRVRRDCTRTCCSLTSH